MEVGWVKIRGRKRTPGPPGDLWHDGSFPRPVRAGKCEPSARRGRTQGGRLSGGDPAFRFRRARARPMNWARTRTLMTARGHRGSRDRRAGSGSDLTATAGRQGRGGSRLFFQFHDHRLARSPARWRARRRAARAHRCRTLRPRQPCSAATPSSSPAASRSMSSALAIRRGATRASSARRRSSVFSRSTAAGEGSRLRRGRSRRFRFRRWRGIAARLDRPPAGPCPGARRRSPWAPRGCAPAPSASSGRMGGDLHQRLVLEHAVARNVARLRLALAPGGDGGQHGEEPLVAGARLQPLPGILGSSR